MRIETRRRRGLARFGAVLAVASALAIALTGAPANAAARAVAVPKSSGTVMPGDVIGNPTLRFANVNSGKCVAVGGARQDYGAWVIQWTCNPSAEFMWRPF